MKHLLSLLLLAWAWALFSQATHPAPHVLLSDPAGAQPAEDLKPIAAARHVLTLRAPGLDLAPADLLYSHHTTGLDGLVFVHFTQQYAGYPVMGASLRVGVEAGGTAPLLTGTRYPRTLFPPPPATPAEPTEDLVWAFADPWAPRQAHLCRVAEAHDPHDGHHYRTYYDHQTGHRVFRHRLDCDLTRHLYHGSVAGFNLVWSEGDHYPGALGAADREMLLATAETYNLFHRTFGRDSYDGAGGAMRGVTDATMRNCPNATAFKTEIRICAGVMADDVVAHEWTHNYLYFQNGLLNAFESGALNEAYCDVFGEIVDILNDRGLDTHDHQPRTGCDDGNQRWRIAEDITAIDTTLRDLYAPECKFDPDSRDSPYYACSDPDDDRGGVHTNSGLVNHLFTLLADGGVHGQDTIAAIGLTRAAHLFYYVAENLMTPVTDFEAFGMLLGMAAERLRGVPLPELTLLDVPPVMATDTFGAAAVAEVHRAIATVGLADPTPCEIVPTLLPSPPGTCAHAQNVHFQALLRQDWEEGAADWAIEETAVNPASYTPKPWRPTDRLPDGRAGLAMFAPNPQSGDCETDIQAGVTTLTTPPLLLPVTETDFVLTFDHYYAIQEEFDGGVLSISRNGRPFRPVLSAAFLHNGYDDFLEFASNNDNPLAGRMAFVGTDLGSTSGSWGRSVVDLNEARCEPGDEIRLRWSMGQDGCRGYLGWFIDEISVGYCTEAVLPVSWTSFTATARKETIELAWATGSETANRGFYVERRAAAGAFAEVGFVAAGEDYRFTDRDVRGGLTYHYRLRQTDTDGSFAYSAVVSAALPYPALRAYPNPTRAGLTLLTERAQTVLLYDAGGRLLKRLETPAGRETYLSTAALSPGVYLLRAGAATQKIVVH